MDSALFLYCESYYDDQDIGPKSADGIIARLLEYADGCLEMHAITTSAGLEIYVYNMN